MRVEITWLGHASVMIEGAGLHIYVDPWKLKGDLPVADIVLVTHDHYDHYSEDDIRRIKAEDTVVVCSSKRPLVDEVMLPGDNRVIKGVKIEAVPAYNIKKDFHPRANNWVGYMVDLDGMRIYHAGDTDRIPEMKGLGVDVAILPVGGTYTMDAEDAIAAIGDIKPRHVIPIHFGDIVGSKADAERLLQAKTASIHILDPGGKVKLD